MKLFPLKLAQRYVFSGKNAIEVNVISWIAFLALGFVTACLVVILSVFAGLENLNLQFYSNINPELKILPAKGKSFMMDAEMTHALQELQDQGTIQVYSPVIEEKAFISYHQRNHIVHIKGVGENFNQIFHLDTMVKIGNALSPEYPEEIIIGSGISARLNLYVDPQDPVGLFVPKPGEGLISNQEDAFNHINAYSTGIFFINDKYEQYVFASLALTQKLLNFSSDEVSAIEINVSPGNINGVKSELQKQLGDEYVIKTRQELDAAFLKMMNTENLIIYLIFILILIIASFNLAGSVAIIILDKRKDSKTLRSMGMSESQLRQTHFTTGMLITVYALIFGMVVGGLIALLQQQMGLVVVSPTIPFPVKFTMLNFILIVLSVLSIGTIVSWFVSRNVKFNH
ncbi:FtsX-like permease family protein [Flavobacteriaceae bacterium Ap0902]|nr:FtsX-like permease family protein [Flavobacteriaceae bacterium Ap0902]